MARFLAIRFSALGDVAMTVPAVASFAHAYPEHQVYVLSVRRVAPLFENLADNVHFVGVDLKKYKGLHGLHNLYNELQELHIDYIADLHGVLRSNIIRRLFKKNGAKVACIHKGKIAKWRLTRKYFKRMYPVKSTIRRYHDVFARLGFPFAFSFAGLKLPDGACKVADGLMKCNTSNHIMDDEPFFVNCDTPYHVGIAPFASYPGKAYPLEQQELVLDALTHRDDVTVYLFGGGEKEACLLDEWSHRYPHTVSLAGRFSLSEELASIQRLDVLVTMDSANSHLASLVGTRVVSVWGATHPFCGFIGWHEANNTLIQTDLKCRPCSVFGKRSCRRGDYACLTGIEPSRIVSAVSDCLASFDSSGN